MGHGFMMAPIVGKLIAELIAKGKPSEALEPYNLRRFKSGHLLDETMIIG
jgi:sarcosine oxidase subunit beta